MFSGTKNPHQVPMSPGSISPNPKQVLPSSVNTPQLISPSARPSSGINPLLMSSNLPSAGLGSTVESINVTLHYFTPLKEIINKWQIHHI